MRAIYKETVAFKLRLAALVTLELRPLSAELKLLPCLEHFSLHDAHALKPLPLRDEQGGDLWNGEGNANPGRAVAAHDGMSRFVLGPAVWAGQVC
eukprot:364481-Chlamydomonas_euryale.AAC.4